MFAPNGEYFGVGEQTAAAAARSIGASPRRLEAACPARAGIPDRQIAPAAQTGARRAAELRALPP